MGINITERFARSRSLDREEYKRKEQEKLGNLRAGSTGIMSVNGDIAGACHRKSHIRSLGLEVDPPDNSKLIMFSLGYANEDQIFNELKTSLQPGETILREEEIPIEWLTKNSTKVSGRPDMVLCKVLEGVNQPTLLLELKSVHSVWVAREVMFNRKPKLPNLAQAAHYMWKLGVPGKLVYRSYSQLGQGMVSSDWMAKMFPRPGEPLSEFVEYNEKKGTPKHIRQFEVVYDLEFRGKGRLQYRVEGEKKWIDTIITSEDIERYFEYVSTLPTNSSLGPRPMSADAQGEKLGYTDCDYCPLQSVCDENEGLGYDKWLTEVRQALKKNIK